MATQGPLSPGTMAYDNTIGNEWWSNPNNAKISDDNYASSAGGQASPVVFYEHSIKLYKAGTISGNEKSTGGALPSIKTYISYGSSSDLWGLTLTAEDINNSGFGVGFSCTYDLSGSFTYYLKATNFGFSIPTGAAINGILVEIQEIMRMPTTDFPAVDHIRITVYYNVVDYTIAVSVGAFILTGIAVILTRTLNIITSVGEFTLTGIAVGLNKGWTIAVSVGQFTLTGITISFTKSLKLIAETGIFILTGIDAVLKRGYTILASVGSFVLTGISSLLKLERLAEKGLIKGKERNFPSGKKRGYPKGKEVSQKMGKEL